MTPAPEITFRAAAEDDFETLVTIECASLPNAWSRQALRYWIAHPRALARVAIGEAGILAFAVTLVEDRSLHLANMAVRPDWRRAGVGRRMLAHVIGLATELSLDDVVLEVRESNLTAQLLYRCAGFRAERILRRYYGAEDGYLMRRRLTAAPRPA